MYEFSRVKNRWVIAVKKWKNYSRSRATLAILPSLPSL